MTENHVISATRKPSRPRIKLTVRGLDNPKAPVAGHKTYRYKETPALEHRVYARQGHTPPQQTFYFGPYRVRGNPKSQRFPLGEWRVGDGDNRLADILARWRQAREDVRAGIDPKVKAQTETAARQRAEQEAATGTVDKLLDNYLKRDVRARELRSADLIETTFDRLVRPRIGARSKHTLRRSEIVAMLDEIADENGERMADLTLAFLRAAFSWEERRSDTFRSPIVRGMARLKPKERARQRTLSDEEIRDLWAALEVARVPATYPRFVKALVLTAARRGEVSHMRWEELDGDAWVIPPERSKPGNEHVVPLTAPVLALLGGRRKSGFILASNGEDRPLTGYSKAKRELDRAIAEIRAREGRPPMSHWTYHDLRRSARSLMSRAGVPSDIAERVLGHALQGVRATYDRHHYLAEKRDALERLAALVDRILHPPGDNVANLDEVRAARP